MIKTLNDEELISITSIIKNNYPEVRYEFESYLEDYYDIDYIWDIIGVKKAERCILFSKFFKFKKLPLEEINYYTILENAPILEQKIIKFWQDFNKKQEKLI